MKSFTPEYETGREMTDRTRIKIESHSTCQCRQQCNLFLVGGKSVDFINREGSSPSIPNKCLVYDLSIYPLFFASGYKLDMICLSFARLFDKWTLAVSLLLQQLNAVYVQTNITYICILFIYKDIQGIPRLNHSWFISLTKKGSF